MTRRAVSTRSSSLSLAPAKFATFYVSILKVIMATSTKILAKIRIRMRTKEQVPMDTLYQRAPRISIDEV
jgi:hypothetical protein